jgi:hypothetical protein
MRFSLPGRAIAAAIAAVGLLLAAPTPPSRSSLVITQVPVGADLGSGPGALKGSRLVLVSPDGATRILTSGFAAAADPDVSFDGQRVLFAGKRSSTDPWDIFELHLETSAVRRITRDLGDCRQPVYQSTLYTIDSAEPWFQITFVTDVDGERNPDDGTPATSLYSCRLDGSEVRRLTYRPWSSSDPFLMPDGRILFATRNGANRTDLFAANSDGTDVTLFSGPEGGPVKRMPAVTDDGLVVFVEPESVEGAGQLAAVSLRRNLHSYRRITDDPAFRFLSPSPVEGGGVLVSRRPADGAGTAGLFHLDPETGSLEPWFDDPERHDVQARAVQARPKPDGRSSVVNYKDPNGKLYCLNLYMNDLEDPRWMSQGTVRRLRVLEGIPRRDQEPAANEPGLPAKRFLGEIDVMEDGSFNVSVPANTPIQLQLVDEHGMALRTCDWIWARNREPRGCIGCHEDGELTPENRFVDAVQAPSVELTAPPDERRAVDFRGDVMRVLQARCATSGCHGAGGHEPDLSADRQAYKALLAGAAADQTGRYVHPGQARTSPLIWRLVGHNTSRPWDDTWVADANPTDPHPGAGLLSPEEMQTLVEWIDLGALWRGLPEEDAP